jgi:tetratricopeptide (TPR) repeat protein
VIVAIDDVQWLDVPSARVLAFAVRRLGNAPIRILVALRVGSGGDPLALGQTGPVTLQRVPIGPLPEEAMTRLLRARAERGLTRPTLLRLHRISEGNPLFALEIARALTERGVRPAPGEPLPVPEDLQELLGARLAALPSSAADGLLIVAAAARPTEDLVVAAAERRDRAAAGMRSAEEAGVLQRAGGRLGFTHPLLGSTVYAEATPHARRSVHRRLAELVDDPEERARHLALAAGDPHLHVARALEEAGRHARARGAPDAAAELLELARKLTPPEDGAGLPRRSVAAAEYHFDAGDATRATALLEESIAMARPGRDRARIHFRLASISWLDMRRVRGLSEQALQEVEGDAETRAAIREHLAWVGIYRGDLAFAAEHASASVDLVGPIADPAVRADSLSTFAMVEFLLGRPAQSLMSEAVQLQDLAMRKGPGSQTTVFTASRTCHGLQLLWAGELDAAREVLHQELTEYERLGRYVVRDELLCYLAEAECRAGNWEVAARHAQEAYEIDVESGRVLGQGHMLFPRALVAALTGDVDAARSDAEEGLRRCLLNPGRAGRHRGAGLPGQAGGGRSAPRSPGAPGTDPGSAVGHRHRRARPWAAHRGPGRSVGGTLGAGASPGGAPACATALRAGPDPAGDRRGGAQSQAEASRPLHPGAGAWSLPGPRCAVVGAEGARRPRPCRRCDAAVQRAHAHRATDRPACRGREEEP